MTHDDDQCGPTISCEEKIIFREHSWVEGPDVLPASISFSGSTSVLDFVVRCILAQILSKFNSSKQNKARKHKSKSIDDYTEERPPSKSIDDYTEERPPSKSIDDYKEERPPSKSIDDYN